MKYDLDKIKELVDNKRNEIPPGQWLLVVGQLTIAERLEAQVEVMERILEAVNKRLAVKPGTTKTMLDTSSWPDCKPESAAWKHEPDNLGPCGGE